jgi:phospholipid/cholesterol/gamma-HCH transport system ATP-binding protein
VANENPPDSKSESKTVSKLDSQPDSKLESKSESTLESKADDKTEIDIPAIPEPLAPPPGERPEVQAVEQNSGEESPYYFEFRDVTKGFGGRPILDHVSFRVKRGETCVIMGRSGVGKSVSLKHILGFLKPDSGQVFIDGQDVTDWTEEEFQAVRRKVSMVFQSGALFDSLTVRENIAFPLEDQPGLNDDDIEAYVAKLAHTLEVDDSLDKLPGELSTGARRAVAIARSLAQNPEAILYDEPTTMVDPIMAAHMGDLILRLKEAFHKTSIVVTHDTHLAKKLADSVVFLQDGKVSFFGTWKQFENSKDEFLHNFLAQDQLIPAMDVTL